MEAGCEDEQSTVGVGGFVMDIGGQPIPRNGNRDVKKGNGGVRDGPGIRRITTVSGKGLDKGVKYRVELEEIRSVGQKHRVHSNPPKSIPLRLHPYPVPVTLHFTMALNSEEGGARIRTHLSDMTVYQDSDAEFTIELSTSVLGTWHMKGQQLHNDQRFKIDQSRTRHSLLIRGVKVEENESEITFVAHGVRDSAVLFVK
eukprot:g31444.t1